MSYMQLFEGGFQVVYPRGLWSQFSGVVKVLYMASKLFTFTARAPAGSVLTRYFAVKRLPRSYSLSAHTVRTGVEGLVVRRLHNLLDLLRHRAPEARFRVVPLHLLWRHVPRRRHPTGGMDQEYGCELAHARAGGVGEVEGCDAVLQGVGPAQHAPRHAQRGAEGFVHRAVVDHAIHCLRALIICTAFLACFTHSCTTRTAGEILSIAWHAPHTLAVVQTGCMCARALKHDVIPHISQQGSELGNDT